ncbi:TetR/AcrR family transcriptional regulator [Nonomuraea endophytica]|uniref:AcrR family transcriptional regulator n=1 Tax=Nonomuraea endophytica TaxID=714136 RepID=A0A7W8EMA9_9ACTN|nr:TetR/AcrR family transcriptional regulator [Nonomuraea endophytica]MBB5084491.1 AcrR family transcriptional regulator [Nonomuraea endophytica]
MDLRELPLRERKKARTRQALAETALRLFTEKGFEATTLDELVDAVEVSKRTFFRTFPSKEDVALATDNELWSVFLAEVAVMEIRGPVTAAFLTAVRTALGRMDDGWAERFLATRALCARVPAVEAHSLRYCNDTTRAAVERLAARLGRDRGDVSLSLAVEISIAAWRHAALTWTDDGGEGGLPGLLDRLDHAFAAIPSAVTVSA